MTDAGYTVMFNACGVKIYKNRGLRVSGKEVHHECRDSLGLYPLTLNPITQFSNMGEAPREVRAQFMSTARQILINAREERENRNKTVQSEALHALPACAQEETLGTLARVYPREDMSVLEKWHNRCGHASVKSLKAMGISELQGKQISVRGVYQGKDTQNAAQGDAWLAQGEPQAWTVYCDGFNGAVREIDRRIKIRSVI